VGQVPQIAGTALTAHKSKAALGMMKEIRGGQCAHFKPPLPQVGEGANSGVFGLVCGAKLLHAQAALSD
jgi:hypothetical protein